MSGGYALQPAELDAVVGSLGNGESGLSHHARSLAVTPDAGRSSGEVANAFASLSVATGALAHQISDISSALADNVSQYRAVDERVAGRYAPGGLPR